MGTKIAIQVLYSLLKCFVYSTKFELTNTKQNTNVFGERIYLHTFLDIR